MYVKKLCKLLLPLVLALGLLAGCGRAVYSSRAVSAVNKAQTVVSFTTSTELDNALRKAVQAGSDLTAVRDALLKELEYSDAAYFSVSGVRSARAGQHAVQVYRVSGSVSAAAEGIAEEIAGVLHALRSGGEYTGHISMVKDNGSCYIAVDLTIVKQAAGSSSGSDEGSGDEEPSEPTAQSIAVSGLKKTYTAGDEISTDELTVIVTFSDGTTKELGTDEYAIDYDFSSKGEKDVTVTYKADPSVSCTVTVTVEAAYNGKKVAIFIGTPYYEGVGTPGSSYFVNENCEGIFHSTSIFSELPSQELQTVRGQIRYTANSPLAIDLAELILANSSVDANTLHEKYQTSFLMSDLDKIITTMKENNQWYNIISFVVADVIMSDVSDLSVADKEAANTLNNKLLAEIKAKAPEEGEVFQIKGTEYKLVYSNSSQIGMIREHIGGMNFKYYAVVGLQCSATRV